MIRTKSRIAALGMLVALASLATGAGHGLTQEGTPAPSEQPLAHHPAHIHQGTCASPESSSAYAVTEIAMDMEAMGQGLAVPALTSISTLDVTLADLLASPHALDVHELRELAVEEQGPIACGDLGGQPTGDVLAIGVAEQDGSGLSGIAVLQAAGEQTVVTLYVAHGLAGDAQGEPGQEATSATVAFYVPTITCPGCQARVEASIQQAPGILDIAFDGQTVTVTYDPSAVTPDEIKEAIEAGGDEVYEESAGG